MSRRKPKPAVYGLAFSLEREGLAMPADDDASALVMLSRALRARVVAAEEYAATLVHHADDLESRANRIRALAAARESFAGKAARHEACPVIWKRKPVRGGDEAQIVAIEDGQFVVGGMPNLSYGYIRFPLRGGGFAPRLYEAGQIDVTASLEAWRVFCAARKARETAAACSE